MKKRYLNLAWVIVAFFLIMACGVYYFFYHENKSNNDTKEVEQQVLVTDTTDDDNFKGDSVEGLSNNIIQNEITEVEAKSNELESIDYSDSQYTMNQGMADLLTLWDDELNSIWKRLIEKLPASEKEAFVKEQQAWIKQKDANADAAEVENGGGSAGPTFRYFREEEMTRVRVYYLAEKLAKIQGESFEISPNIQKELDEADYSLDSVLEEMKGQWIFDEEIGSCIGIERSSESAYGQEGSEWTIWLTGGELYTEKDLYGYVRNCVVFHKASDEDSGYIAISTYGDDTIYYNYGSSVEDLMDITNMKVGY